jgi:hypothetical protein
MAVLHDIPQLSIWDLSHYWHSVNPQSTQASNLPVKVQQTLRALALKASKGLYLRCEVGGFIHKVFNEEPVAVSTVSRIYQRELRAAYTGKKYKKKFLSGISMSKKGVLIWCKQTKTEPPSFWFNDDDPLLSKSVSELVSPLSDEQMRKYGYFPMFGKELESPTLDNIFKVSNADSLTIEGQAFKEKNSPIAKAISDMASKNAKQRYTILDGIKNEFIEFYQTSNYKNRKEAARIFFESLNSKARIQLVPTYDETDLAQSKEKAVRTLTNALRDFVAKQSKV